MVIALWPVVALIVGLLVYLLVNGKPKVETLGLWTFIVGLLWTIYSLVGKTLTLG
mgnify:CR=1 FL=1